MILDKAWFVKHYSSTDKSLATLAKESGTNYSMLRKKMLEAGVEPKFKYRGLTTGQRKKGIPPWNKGLTAATDPRQLQAAIKSSKTRIERGSIRGEKHYNWKGSQVKYKPLHNWVNRWKGKAMVCLECGSTRNIDWANISGEYHRDLTDFKSLCRSCHMKYDNARRAK